MPATDHPRGREAVLRALKQQGGMTAQRLASTLGVTPVAVRKQLEALQAEGLVQIAAVKQPRGRPVLVYHLTPAAAARFPQGYRQLALDLIEQIVAQEGEAKLRQLFQARHQRLLRERLDTIAPEERGRRLEELVRLRNEDGYMVTVEERPDGYLIREHHCPIYEVAARFPLACCCEAEFFSAAVNQPVTREASLVEGSESCAFHVPKELPAS
jgi:predicted ArsR family transcriptional regulator